MVDRGAWQAELAAPRIREKAHTREGDTIAAPVGSADLTFRQLRALDAAYHFGPGRSAVPGLPPESYPLGGIRPALLERPLDERRIARPGTPGVYPCPA